MNLNIGERVRQARLQHGFSQGDLEQRTGLLRCYLSRVENGHTEPSLQTLVRIAAALEMPLVAFFNDTTATAPAAAHAAAPTGINEPELAFLAQMRQYAANLSAQDRQQVLSLAQKMARGGA